MVATVGRMGQKALGLTDHVNMAGSVQLYKHAMKAGIKPFPGTELYVVGDRGDKKAKRHHMCVVAFTTEGYQNLVRLSTLSHHNFFHKPIVDQADLAGLAEDGYLKGLAATSGCYFGFTSQAISQGDMDAARSYLTGYAKWFDRFYVELQNHNIDHGNGQDDDSLANALMGLADELGLPCVLTQDSHYCDQHDKETHDALKGLVAFGDDPDDARFPGDGFHLADDQWLRERHHDARFARGCEGLADLLEAHDLTIPELDQYSYRIPFTVADPEKYLRSRTTQELLDRGVDSKRYIDRLETEMSIISDTGMSGYLLLVSEVTDYCKNNRIFYQARGSASGSIVCWLLGITQVDPLKWGLLFERFISRDRTKPPDIDLDVEHSRRPELMTWLESRFSVNQIGTWLQHTITPEDEEDGKGSLRVRYYQRLKKQGYPTPPWDSIPIEDKRQLVKIASHGPFNAYGTHAAGLIVTTTQSEFDKIVPMMKVASSKTTVSQYEMGDIESLGLVKLDVLGLKTLSVLNQTMINLGRDPFEGLDWIPLNDAKTYAAIAKGDTDGVFQLEGYTARRGCRELKPTTINDVVASMALFRPATIQSGATSSYIRRKHGLETVAERHPIIAAKTKTTYGIMVFQEQVIAILRELGMDPDDLTAFLKAVKASNADVGDAGGVIRGYRDQVRGMADAANMTDEDWDWLWGAIEGFAAYGFNQSHSVAYGLTAYRCAYLSVHHALDFYSALLAVAAGTDKEFDYVRAARSKGLRVLKADVNDSGITYGIDPKRRGIRKGMLSIPGVGEKAAEEIVTARPETGYTSIHHLASIVNHRKVTGIKSLRESGDRSVGTVAKIEDFGGFGNLK
jgi:DNA polymerase-3 subunit alpha